MNADGTPCLPWPRTAPPRPPRRKSPAGPDYTERRSAAVQALTLHGPAHGRAARGSTHTASERSVCRVAGGGGRLAPTARPAAVGLAVGAEARRGCALSVLPGAWPGTERLRRPDEESAMAGRLSPHTR